MTASRTGLSAKHRYTRHRRVTGAPVVADTATLEDLKVVNVIPPGSGSATDLLRKDFIDCSGWKTVRVFVKLAGGTTPTVTLVPLEFIEYIDNAGAEQTSLSILTPSLVGMADTASAVAEINSGKLFLRIGAVTGAPTSVEIHVAGEERMQNTPTPAFS